MIVDNFAKSLEESVYYRLEEEILSGALKKGDTLAEISLSRRLGVSRTPIRGAVHRLAEEGLIEIIPNKGAVVIGVNDEDLVNIYKIRMRLEGLASREAAERISDGDKARLTELVELSEFYLAKNDLERLKELDSEFHNIIYRASGNRLLEKTLSELHRNIKAYRRLSLTVPERVALSVKEHREILSAIISGNVEEADKLTFLHIEAALANLLAVSASK